ncbi:MAG: hypothetical protein QUS13_04770 [Smithella sp.]|nr:hypothetical protein [Smithella sp.]
MTTIYKNKNESSWSKYVLCISFSENINKQINDWQTTLNKMVFDEQIKTGSFHGRFPIDDNRRSRMQGLLEKGIIQPYYGATSANASIYTLQVSPPTCIIGVEHKVVEQKVSYEDAVIIHKIDASTMDDDFKKGFVIKEQEYRTLQEWKNWNAQDEFTSRYVYKFSPSSIGLAITIIDTFTNDQIDISDYDNW